MISITNGYLTMPSIILGDFNIIQYTYENIRGKPLLESQLQSFNDYIDIAALIDIQSVED